jgi:glycosyltransferase involved in cell wall biosynthesis
MRAQILGVESMHWIVLTPFHKQTGADSDCRDADDWITKYISPEAHSFQVVPATYAHDRSRKGASGKEWRDYFSHALRGWLAASRSGAAPVGFITAFPQLAAAIGLIKRLTRSQAPVLAWCYNMGQTFEGAKKRFAQFALHSIDLFVVHSRREIATYAEWLGLPSERFVFVPLSVATVSPTRTESVDKPFVLAMGTANRDYRVLVDALTPLKYPATIVAGAHALAGLSTAEGLLTRSGLSGAECRDLCERARIVVIPIDNDVTASGQVSLLEAMMLGKSVIATRCAGLQDYILNGETGLLVPPGDAQTLGDAIQRLWADSDLRRKLGSSALSHANEHFTFRSVADDMGKLLGQLGENAAKAPR